MADQIAEYESQLAEVETLLQASPEDASLLSLKSDLRELLEITKGQQSAGAAAAAPGGQEEESKPSSTTANVFDQALQAAVGTSVGAEGSQLEEGAAAAAAASAAPAAATNTFADTVQEAAAAAAAAASAAGIPTSIDTSVTAANSKDVPKKRASKINKVKAEFQVPPHLIPLDTDSAAERNKKRRALKALKSKWRESKKEAESAQKQKSWQSFQKKKKLKTKSSMFSTTATGDAAVGVVVAPPRRQKDA